jgi:hypothetical protein
VNFNNVCFFSSLYHTILQVSYWWRVAIYAFLGCGVIFFGIFRAFIAGSAVKKARSSIFNYIIFF